MTTIATTAYYDRLRISTTSNIWFKFELSALEAFPGIILKLQSLIDTRSAALNHRQIEKIFLTSTHQ